VLTATSDFDHTETSLATTITRYIWDITAAVIETKRAWSVNGAKSPYPRLVIVTNEKYTYDVERGVVSKNPPQPSMAIARNVREIPTRR
jgi:hypothetical protein